MALVVVLMMLVVITVLGVGSAQLTLQAERSSRNDRDTDIARQSAEQALADAERDIQQHRTRLFRHDNEIGFEPGCSSANETRGLCQAAEPQALPAWVMALDNDARAVALGTFTHQGGDHFGQGVQPARRPRYVIEALPDNAPCNADGSADQQTSTLQPTCRLLRITAIGYGPNPDTRVVLQTEFRFE